MSIKNLIVIPALVIASLASLRAETITQTQGFSASDLTSAFDTSLSFDGFNSSLGTLNSVTITIGSVSIHGSIVADNSAGAAASTIYQLEFRGNFSVADESGNINNQTSASIQSADYGNENGTVTVGAHSTRTFGPSTTTTGDVSATVTDDPATGDISYYIGGTNAITVDVSGSFRTTVDMSGAQAHAESTYSGSGDVTIVYDYTPNMAAVPEPGQTAAVLLGLGACVLIGRLTLKRKAAVSTI